MFPAILFAIAIFVLSSRPVPPEAEPYLIFPQADKVVHFVEYAIFGLLLYVAYDRGGFERLRQSPALLSVVTGIGYAISDEIHQSFVPGRDSSVEDLLVDCIGILFAVVAIAIRAKRLEEATTASVEEPSNEL